MAAGEISPTLLIFSFYLEIKIAQGVISWTYMVRGTLLKNKKHATLQLDGPSDVFNPR